MPVMVHVVVDIDPSEGRYALKRGFFSIESAVRLRNDLNKGRRPEPEESTARVWTVEVE